MTLVAPESIPYILLFASLATLSYVFILNWLALPFVLLLVHELLGRPILFLRWNMIMLVLNRKKAKREWQCGDGREQACLDYVRRTARLNPTSVLAAIDRFSYYHYFLMNVGPEKGALIDRAVKTNQPQVAVELGSYVGYGALRIAVNLPPSGKLFTVEKMPKNAELSRAMLKVAGLSEEKAEVVLGTISQDSTLDYLRSKFSRIDLLFIDHDRKFYLSDLKRLMEVGLVQAGTRVLVDNCKIPGCPDFTAYMDGSKEWQVSRHTAPVAYQRLMTDVMYDCVFLGPAGS